MSYDLRATEPGASLLHELHRVHCSKAPRRLWLSWLGLKPLTSDEKPWLVGYQGELIAARALQKLSKKGWVLLHSVPVGKRGSDIDHVAISPKGVLYTLNTKHHRGAKLWMSKTKLLVNGRKQEHLHNSLFEAQRIQKKFSRPTIPVLIIVGAKSLKQNQDASQAGVCVSSPEKIVKDLQKIDSHAPDSTITLPQGFFQPELWAESWGDLSSGHDERKAWLQKLERALKIASFMKLIYALGAALLGSLLIFMLVSNLDVLLGLR